MPSAKGSSFSLASSGLGLLAILLVGGGLGFLFSGDLYAKPPHELMRSIALGLVWAALLVHWVDIILQSLSLTSDPAPEELDLGDPGAVASHIEDLSKGSMLVSRSRRLLAALANGANGQQLVEMASFQSQQAKNSIHATLAFAVVLLVASLWDTGNTLLSWAAILLLAVTLYARRNLLSRIDLYIETNILSRVASGSGAAVAAAPAAAASGNQEEMREAIQTAFEGMRSDLSSLNETIGNLATQMNGGGGGEWADELTGALARHSDSMQQTNAQLETTLSSLRSHIEESGKIVKDLAKPRRIRLVESQVQAAAPQPAPQPIAPPEPAAEEPAPQKLVQQEPEPAPQEPVSEE